MEPAQHEYLLHGPDAVGTETLLGLVVGQPALATSLTDTFGGLAAVRAASPAALARVLGKSRAVRLHAAFALAQRAAVAEAPRGLVRRAPDAAGWLVPRFEGLGHEEVHALFLDGRARVISAKRMSQGGFDRAYFDVRLFLAECLRVGAASLIVAHNHPSGAIEPSAGDLLATRRLEEGAEFVGVELADHLIVAGAQWSSLAERGELRRGRRGE